MTSASNENIDQLVAQLGDENPAARNQARAALVQIGAPVVPALLGALDAPQDHVRWEAAKSLAEIADPSAAQRLAQALGDENEDVRWVAADALAALGKAAVKPLLSALTAGDLPDGMRQSARHVVRELSKRRELAPLLAPVLEAFKEPEQGIALPVAAEKALESYTG